MASLTASMATIYFASVVDNVAIDYKVAFQLITLPHKVNTYLVRDFLSKSPTKSKST